jgi:hypothetical protein
MEELITKYLLQIKKLLKGVIGAVDAIMGESDIDHIIIIFHKM